MTPTSRVVAVLGLVLSLAGCNCGTQVSKRYPRIEVIDEAGAARTSVEFGQVQLNFSAVKKVRIRNSGAAALTLEQETFSNPLFAAGDTLPLTIGVNEEFELALTFTPTVADQRETGTVTLKSDDPARPTVQLQLAGTGVTATAVVQPAMLAFGDVYVGEMKTLSFALTNSGSNDLPVTAVRLVNVPASVTADLSPLMKTLTGGETVTITLRYAPTAVEVVMGSLELDFPAGIGSKRIPLTGAALQAQPKLCFKFDDETTERCTDGTAGMNLDVQFGTLCDERVYPPDGGLRCELDGGAVPYQRSGVMFVRNDGNTPVSFAMTVSAGQPQRCDGGASIDFQYANAPLGADGGPQAGWIIPTVTLPTSVNDPRDWKTAPVAVTYRPRSICNTMRESDAADQSTIIWARQNEPLNTMRRPNTMIATFNGSSVLANLQPFQVTFTGNSPMPQDVSLVVNRGPGPVRVVKAELWQSLDGGMQPGVRCADVDAGPCTHFSWIEGPTLPQVLEGTALPTAPVGRKIGRLAYGTYTVDGGVYVPPSAEQRVWAIVDTSDPYAPQLTVPIIGRLQ